MHYCLYYDVKWVVYSDRVLTLEIRLWSLESEFMTYIDTKMKLNHGKKHTINLIYDIHDSKPIF